MRRLMLVAISVTASMILACAGDTPEVNPAPLSNPDTGSPSHIDSGSPDTGQDANVDASADTPVDTNHATTFEAAGEVGPGMMGLRLKSVDPQGAITLEMVIGKHDNVYGVGAGLSFDPTRLQLVSFTSTAALEGSDGIALAKDNTKGRISIALTKKGNQTGKAFSDTTALATIVVRPTASGRTPIKFMPSLTSVRDDMLRSSTTSPQWVGGDVVLP